MRDRFVANATRGMDLWFLLTHGNHPPEEELPYCDRRFREFRELNPSEATPMQTRFTRYQRSLQIWTLLVCAARDRKCFTYGDVARVLGMKGAGVMSSFLDPVMRYCARNGYPPLTVLVVNKTSGLPGEGLTTLEETNADRERVFRFNWFAVRPPESDDFRAAIGG